MRACLIKGPTETTRVSQHYRVGGYKGALNYAESRSSFSSRDESFSSQFIASKQFRRNFPTTTVDLSSNYFPQIIKLASAVRQDVCVLFVYVLFVCFVCVFCLCVLFVCVLFVFCLCVLFL